VNATNQVFCEFSHLNLGKLSSAIAPFVIICHQSLSSEFVIRVCHQGAMTDFHCFVIRSPSFCHQIKLPVIMPNPLLSVRIPTPLDEMLKQKETDSGKSRSDLTVEALRAYLCPPSADDELGQLR
jgi:hypothetical protein